MAVHRKELPDDVFLAFLPIITRESNDDRNFVRKAVNWALRQIGKRNARLRVAAIAEARKIRALGSRAARWIASDALRELERDQGLRTARSRGANLLTQVGWGQPTYLRPSRIAGTKKPRALGARG